MVIVFIIILVICVILDHIAKRRYWGTEIYFWGAGLFSFGVSIVVLMTSFFLYIDKLTINDKIAMYQEENKSIEQEITTIVNNFQGYEKEIISSVGDMETILIKVPELKSSELVNKQIEVYVSNNNKIKELKEEKIDADRYKWLLYFGGVIRMFSPLTRKDIDDIKNILNKSEYDKHVEPLNKQINVLTDMNDILRENVRAMYYAVQRLINSIDKDYINIVINKTNRVARFFDGTNELADDDIQIVPIPIKQDLKDDFSRTYQEFLKEMLSKRGIIK